VNETEQMPGARGSAPLAAGAGTSVEITSHALLDQIRSVLAERRGQGREILPPQALEPLALDEVEALEYYPWRRPIGSRDALKIEDLIECPRDLFVRRCFRLLARRDPDESEAASAERLLDLGWDRLVLIARLRWTGEGRRAGVPLQSFARRLPWALSRSLRRRIRFRPRKAP
jgi:hypothetical protein